jgi:hypothetical protein
MFPILVIAIGIAVLAFGAQAQRLCWDYSISFVSILV